MPLVEQLAALSSRFGWSQLASFDVAAVNRSSGAASVSTPYSNSMRTECQAVECGNSVGYAQRLSVDVEP